MQSQQVNGKTAFSVVPFVTAATLLLNASCCVVSTRTCVPSAGELLVTKLSVAFPALANSEGGRKQSISEPVLVLRSVSCSANP